MQLRGHSRAEYRLVREWTQIVKRMNIQMKRILYILFIYAHLNLVSSEEELCADESILRQRFQQLTDCVLSWLRTIPADVDQYCKSPESFKGFCSRLATYKKESKDSCKELRGNLKHWAECLAYLNVVEKENCNQDQSCKQINLVSAVVYCNQKKKLEEYQMCMEGGSTPNSSFFKSQYFGVPTYMIIIIACLIVVVIILLVIYVSEKKKKKSKKKKRKKKKKKKYDPETERERDSSSRSSASAESDNQNQFIKSDPDA